MKKYLVLVLMSLSTITYTQANKIVTTMSPTDRHNLFLSTKEVADAYKSLGRIKKANSFYRSAIFIYPIGDQAHQLANQFEIPLDDEETYTNFVLFGDTNFTNQEYKIALYSYLMADELDNSPVLYQKIATSYEALGYSENAAFYQELGKNADLETPTDDTDMDQPTYEDSPIFEEGLDVEPTDDEMTLEADVEEDMDSESDSDTDLDYVDDAMTIEAENILSERILTETEEEYEYIDNLNDILEIDYEEQLN